MHKLQAFSSRSALLCGPVLSAVLSCAERILHSKSLIYSSLLFASWTGICIYLEQLLCAVTMPDKIGGAGAVQTQACQSPAAALASVGAYQVQSAAAWSNGAQSTSGLHHAACLEPLAMAGQQQGIAHHSTGPRHQCDTQKFHLCLHLRKAPRLQQCAASLQPA